MIGRGLLVALMDLFAPTGVPVPECGCFMGCGFGGEAEDELLVFWAGTGLYRIVFVERFRLCGRRLDLLFGDDCLDGVFRL